MTRSWDNGPVYIIAEAGSNWRMGTLKRDLAMARALIDVAVEARADAVKFQTHIAAEESTLEEPWRVKFSKQDASRYDYWKRMEFLEDQWHGLKAHATERKLLFLSSPFSLEAVRLLQKVGVFLLNVPHLWQITSPV